MKLLLIFETDEFVENHLHVATYKEAVLPIYKPIGVVRHQHWRFHD